MFLHHVLPGPASQSYGLAVAQLAGVPDAVIRRAREHLARLEQTSLAHEIPPPAKTREARQIPQQADLFAAQTHPLLDELDALDPDGLTPRQALELIYAWKTRI